MSDYARDEIMDRMEEARRDFIDHLRECAKRCPCYVQGEEFGECHASADDNAEFTECLYENCEFLEDI